MVILTRDAIVSLQVISTLVRLIETGSIIRNRIGYTQSTIPLVQIHTLLLYIQLSDMVFKSIVAVRSMY